MLRSPKLEVYEADYYVPLLAHASMERWFSRPIPRRQGDAVGSDAESSSVQDIVSKELGISKEDVICHVTLLGGGFGRKSKPDYVAEAAVLSKRVGRPGKWSGPRGRHQV